MKKHRSTLGMFQGAISKICQRLKSSKPPGTATQYSDSSARQPSPLRSDPSGKGLTRSEGVTPGFHLDPLIELKICLFFLAVRYIFRHTVLRWMQQACFSDHASKEVESMLAEGISHIYREVEDIQKTLNDVKKSASGKNEPPSVAEKRAWLESWFVNHSETALICDERTRLQRLADEIREFSEDKKLYQLKQVVEITLDEAKEFQDGFNEPAPDSVFEALETAIKTFKDSFHLVLRAAKYLRSVKKLDENSTTPQLRIWAESLEILGEEIENNFPLIESEALDAIEEVCETIVLKTRSKGKNAKNKRESYRRRLRFAAGFILNLVETAREEAEEEDELLLQEMQILGEEALDDIYDEDEEPWNLEALGNSNT